MLANFLNKSKPINLIGLLVFFFLNYIGILFFSTVDGNSVFSKVSEIFIITVLFLFIFFFHNFIISKNNLTRDNSYAYFIFTLFCICLAPVLSDSFALIQDVIYLLFLRKIYSLRSHKNVLEKLFDSGFWLGLFFIIDPTIIVFLLLIYFGILIHHKITFHTIFAPIVGFITPLFLYFTYQFWFDRLDNFTGLFEFNFDYSFLFYSNGRYPWLLLFVGIVSLISIILKSIEALSINDTFKKSWILLILNFLLVIVYLFFAHNKSGSELFYLLFPVSVFAANGIELIKKNKIKNIILLTWLFCLFYLSYFL